MSNRLRRALGAAALGGGLLVLWTGTASAEPDVNLSETTIDVDDLLVGRDATPTADVELPLGAEALLGDNDAVVGDPDAPVAAEVVTSPLPDPVVGTPPAEAEATVDDTTATVVAPVATVDPDVVVCGNAVGVVGDASADCGTAADAGTTGTTAEPGSVDVASDDVLPGTAVGGDLPEVVADPDVLVCGNAVGVVGDASGDCAPSAEPAPVARAGSLDLVLGAGTPVSGTALDGRLPGIVADPDAVVCGNGVGVLGDGTGGCAPTAASTPVAGDGSFELLLGGDTPVSGTTLAGEAPGVVAAPDVLACGNGVGVLGDGSGGCAAATSLEPVTPMDVVGLGLDLGGTTPLTGSSADVDLSSAALDPDATVCGNGVGVLGDGSGTCGSADGPVPGLPVDPAGTVGVVIGLGDDETVGIGPVVVGGSGTVPTPVGPTPPTPPAPTPAPGLGAGGVITPFGVGAAGFVTPLGSAGAATLADSVDLVDLAASAGSAAGDLLTGAAGAALAVTGFGIRSAFGIALVLLALGALLLAGRRRVELLAPLA